MLKNGFLRGFQARARFFAFSLSAMIGVVASFASAADRPSRDSRLDRSLLRDNLFFGDGDRLQSEKLGQLRLVAAAVASEVALENEPPGKPLPDAPPMRPAAKEDIARIEAVDRRYQGARSVSMDLVKTLKLSALGRERKARGRVLVSKGRMRMEIDSPDKSLLVLDKKSAWLVNYPPEEFKGAAIQVVKANVSSKRARSQAIVGLLAQGGFLKHFSVVGVMATPATGASGFIYFLQPDAQLVEFTRAQARLTPDGKNLLELRYWDEIGNETALTFSNVRLNAPAPESAFQYVPPQDADVTTI